MPPCSENRIDNLTMFWDRVAGVYDLFANYYNAGTHRVLCQDSAAQDDCLGEQSSGLTGGKAEKADEKG